MTEPSAEAAPATLVIAAEYDPPYSEDVTYVDRMREADADVSLLVAPGMIHAFGFFETLVPDEIDRLHEVIGDYLRTGRAATAW